MKLIGYRVVVIFVMRCKLVVVIGYLVILIGYGVVWWIKLFWVWLDEFKCKFVFYFCWIGGFGFVGVNMMDIFLIY